MINLLLGRPGSGKSYEAVTFHLLDSLKNGRKVVTNLPIQTKVLFSFFPEYSDLLEIKTPQYDYLPFSTIEDFNDTWRGKDEIGCLYIIDECHRCFPSQGTPRALEEWFAEHRHLGVDILLITQSYRKLSRSLVDMIQVCYRLSNNRTLGTDKSYIRKVQDGVRGEVLNTTVRTYNKSMFQFYKSHTKTNTSVKESQATDLKPIWSHWSFVGAAIFLAIGIPFFIYSLINKNPITHSLNQPKPQPIFKESTIKHISSPQPVPQTIQTKEKKETIQIEKTPSYLETPFGKVSLHIAGFIKSEKKTLYQFVASQNGQYVFNLSHNDLVLAGYKIKANGSCNAELIYNNISFFVICDAPRVGLNLPNLAHR